MYFKNFILYALSLSLFSINSVFAGNLDEIDYLRQELYCSKNKTSQSYITNKKQLENLIKQENINYTPQFKIKDAERLINENKLNAAMYELEDLINQDIEVSKANELIANICLMTSRNNKDAIYYYQKSIQSDSKNGYSAYKLAKIYMNENNNILALDYFNQAIENIEEREILNEIEEIVKNKITPLNNNQANVSYEILGKIYAKLNRTKEAYEAYSKAITLNPDDICIKYNLGDLFFINNKNDNAIMVYNSILKETPGDSQIRATKAKALAKTGNLLGANKEYNEILTKYPNSMQAKYGIYKIYSKKLPIEKIMEKMYASNPSYKITPNDYIAFADFLNSIGDFNGKNAFLAYANKLNDNSASNQNKIDKTFENSLATKASAPKKTLTKQDALTIKKQTQNPKKTTTTQNSTSNTVNENAIIARERAQAINKDPKKYKQYKMALDSYLKIEPKTTDVYMAIANTSKIMGEPTSAIKYYKEAIKSDPTNSDIYYATGLTYMELNQIYKAKEYLEKAVGLNKDNTKAINLLAFVNQKIITHVLNEAYSKYERKEYIEAFEILDNNIKNYPNNAQLYYYRALIFDAMKRNAAQIIDLQKAIELDPSYYMAYYQLAIAYEKIKDERSALVAYERFLSIEPDEPELIKEVQRKVEILGKKFY